MLACLLERRIQSRLVQGLTGHVQEILSESLKAALNAQELPQLDDGKGREHGQGSWVGLDSD